MPYKHNKSRRPKMEKARYKVTNWPEYNKALRQRGDITIWFTEEALAAWHPAKTGAISKRSISIPRHVLSQALEPGSLVIIDSTGLKVYGKDEWHQEKHDVPAAGTS